MNGFINFLEQLGFKKNDPSFKRIDNTKYRYSLLLKERDEILEEHPFLDYIYLPQNNNFRDNLFNIHRRLWNENRVSIFIVVSDNNTSVFNAKVKPDDNSSFGGKIKDFSYGINSPDFSPDKLEELRKESIDSGYFWEFARKHIKHKEVDEDLLLNLLALRDKLREITGEELIPDLLILRCLFLKFLEDREFIQKQQLETILKENEPALLIEEFNEVSHLLNGDIFNPAELQVSNINPACIKELHRFFTTDYRISGRLFPYQFDIIPIELISNVYEAFLKTEDKKEKGIYYTPLLIVNLILSHTLEKIQDKGDIRILDPACGSGIFLVQAFKRLISGKTLEEKIQIMKKSIFGIDIDEKAIPIAIFSLYLALLENENAPQIREEIKQGKIKLPRLKEKNLIHANALLDSTIFDNQKFDCIVGNPPWGAESNVEEQKKLLQKMPVVSDYQRSQAFLLKVDEWADENTVIGMVVNNSIFYNSEAEKFRKELLTRFRLQCYYELSGVNKILFQKRKIGDIVLGAKEPSAVLILDKMDRKDHEVLYITPTLNRLSEFLKIIAFCEEEIKRVKQEDLLEEDMIWRIFVQGDWEDYQLIKKKYIERDKDIQVSCNSGFQPKKEMEILGEPEWRELIKPEDFEQYYIKNSPLGQFNWNQKLRRRPDETIFTGERLLFKSEPSPSDQLRLRGIFTNKDMVFKHHIVSIKINEIKDYRPYLAILNSSFIGYYLYHISSQWGKGKTRNTLRNEEIENLPFPGIDYESRDVQLLIELVREIEKLKEEYHKMEKLFPQIDVKPKENEIDEIVFNLYNLKPYEKERIRDFYLLNVERHKKPMVTSKDMLQYVNKFRKLFYFVLEEDKYLNTEYSISSNLGASVCFRVVNKKDMQEIPVLKSHDGILAIVKKEQVKKSMLSNALKEEKIKIYEDDGFYMIKSNQFRDWTITEARNDAKEEIGQILKNLPKEKK